MFVTGMGLVAIGASECTAQGNRGGGGKQGGGKQGGGKQGGGNQGGGKQEGGKQGGGKQGGGKQDGDDEGNRGGNQGVGRGVFQGGGNFGGGFLPQGAPPTGGGGLVPNQGIRLPSIGGNPLQNGLRSPLLNPPAIRVPNLDNGINSGTGIDPGLGINPNFRGNGFRPGGIPNQIAPNNGFGLTPFGPNATERTVNRPSIGNVGNVVNRFYNGNSLNAGVGLYQPAYTRHAGYHGSWNGNHGNHGPQGGSGYNNGFYSGLGFGGGYGIANGNWGYGDSFGNLNGLGYDGLGGFGGYGYRPLGWGLGGWGLGSLAYGSGYLGYSNPYYVNSGVSVYNYSQPIPVTYRIENSPRNVNSVSVEQMFAGAVAAFKRNDYDSALARTNQGISQFPDDAVLHELRALIYFAQGDYQGAAGTIHSVLAVGPGWDWTTLVGMYSDVAVYTAQLRALELYVRSNPQDAGPQFLLAYQYMSCGHPESAATYLRSVVRLMPNDRVAIDLLQMLSSTIPDAFNTATPSEPFGSNVPKSNAAAIRSETLFGTWTASRSDSSKFVLTLANDSRFSWRFTPQGHDTQTFEGTYMLENDVLSLNRNEGGTLVASLTQGSPKQFNFRLMGAPKEDQGLTFEK